MQIAVLGAGRVGTTLAQGWARAGHDVVVGVREAGARDATGSSPATPSAGSAPGPEQAPLAEAAGAAQVVVNALPGGASLSILQEVGAAVLSGKVLIDVANAVDEQFELLHPNASLGAAVQKAFPATRVVKTLNTVPAAVMTRPGSLAAPSSVFLSGDDTEAKEVTAALLSDLGWERHTQVDLGGIETARASEHYLYLSLSLMAVTGSTSYNIHLVQGAAG